MFGRVRRAVFGGVSAPLLPAVIDREASVRDDRAGDGAARAFEGVPLMGLAARTGPRLPHSRAGREGASREPSDAGVVRRRVGRHGAQGQDLAPGMGAGGDMVVSEAGIHVRACQRRLQPAPGLSLRLILSTCLLLLLGSVSCWFSAAAADFRVNPQEVPKDYQLVCFGEQPARNVLARLFVLQTVHSLPREEAGEQLMHEMVNLQKEEFEDCFLNRFAVRPHQFGIVLDVEEMGLGSWGDIQPYYFVQATVEYKGKWYSANARNGAKVFPLVDSTVVKKIDPASE